MPLIYSNAVLASQQTFACEKSAWFDCGWQKPVGILSVTNEIEWMWIANACV